MIGSFLRGSLLAGTMLALAGPAFADVKAGVDAWSRGDYGAATREWKAPADRGDADAQFNLGQAYKLGRGVPRDLARAEELFSKAAAQGHMQASDNYGLLLFQRGERARAMPYITAASDRGDARAQYLLGLAYFNGENVPKDWVRAYALVSLAQQAGLPQAMPALTQMDQHIPLDQRQQSAKLAGTLRAEADATRARQLAALDLGASAPAAGAPRPASMGSPSFPPRSRVPGVPAAPLKGSAGAGADYTRPKPPPPRIPPVADIIDSEGPPRATAPAPARPIAPAKAAAAKPAAGVWRVQLGAFGVAGNADALWNRVRARPELAGHGKVLAPAGKLTKLQAGGFATQADAQAACGRLSAAGFPCIAVRN